MGASVQRIERARQRWEEATYLDDEEWGRYYDDYDHYDDYGDHDWPDAYLSGGQLRVDWLGQCERCRWYWLANEDSWIDRGRIMVQVCDKPLWDGVHYPERMFSSTHGKPEQCGGTIWEVPPSQERDVRLASYIFVGEEALAP